MEKVEVTFGEGTFEVDIIIVLVEFGKTEGCGDNQIKRKRKES